MKVDVEAQLETLRKARAKHGASIETDPLIAMLRAEIDEVDSELLPLLRRRIATSCMIGMLKKFDDRPIHDPTREEALAARASHENVGVQKLYRRIVGGCREIAQRLVGEAPVSNPVDGGDSSSSP